MRAAAAPTAEPKGLWPQCWEHRRGGQCWGPEMQFTVKNFPVHNPKEVQANSATSCSSSLRRLRVTFMSQIWKMCAVSSMSAIPGRPMSNSVDFPSHKPVQPQPWPPT